MTPNLAENIRTFRKDRRLTQEQLAEVMGVTTGAVHKWEIGASVPDLGMIMELADFFDVSVDVLVGYRMKDNRIEATVRRLAEYCKTLDPEALTEAEKALKKYPNSFDIVDGCASVYLVYAIGNENKDLVHRALELLERALELIRGNTDPRRSEVTIYGKMSDAYLLLGDSGKAIELLKKHNVCGVFSDNIGIWLALYEKKYGEAEQFLSEALINSASDLLDAIYGFYAIYCHRHDYDSALEILTLAQVIIQKLTGSGKTDYFTKSMASMNIMFANVRLLKGNTEEAAAALEEAAALVKRFDTAPDYSLHSLRFVGDMEEASMHDIMGKTAGETAQTLIGILDNKILTKMWEKIYGNKQ